MLNYEDQNKGSTLLLAILVMATMLSTMYAVANLAVRNIKQASTSVRGETAILGADAATEIGLWAHLRNKTSMGGNCDQTPPSYQNFTLSGSLAGVSAQHCSTLLMANPAILDIPRDNPSTQPYENFKEIYIIDPTNPRGPSNYSQMTFSWVSGSGSVQLCRWDTASCTSGPWMTSFSMGSGSNATTVTLNQHDPANNDRYVVLLYGGPQGFGVSIDARDESGNSRGIPADVVTVKGTGQTETVTRILDVKVRP